MSAHGSDKEQNKNSKSRKASARQRMCLSCQRKFISEGAHHRICDGCKTLQGWGTGNPSFYRHRPGAANDN